MGETAKAIKVVLDNPWGLTDKQQVDRLRGVRQTVTMHEFKAAFVELRATDKTYQTKLMALTTIILNTYTESVAYFERGMMGTQANSWKENS